MISRPLDEKKHDFPPLWGERERWYEKMLSTTLKCQQRHRLFCDQRVSSFTAVTMKLFAVGLPP